MDDFVFESRRPVVLSRHGSVACADTRAAQIGLDILKAGGNAADAAVATAAALNVTLPMSCGIGGDVFCLFYNAKTRTVKALNGSGRSPAGLTLEYAKSRGFTPETHWSETHGLTVTVPGAPAGLVDTVNHFGGGKLNLADVFQPAITLAENGFPVSQIGAVYWKKGGHLLMDERNTYSGSLLIDGRPPKWGEVFRNPDLANSFRCLAEEGASGYYKGRVAEAIVEAVKQYGGIMTLDDLANHHSKLEEAISTDFEGVRLWEIGPNSQGIVALMALNLLKRFDLKAMGHNSPDYLHHLIDAFRLSFADAMHYVADPEHVSLPVRNMLSEEYANERKKLINSNRAVKTLTSGNLPVGKDTVYLTVVDADGNACSFIMSNFMGFGTGIVPRGCGFTLQNRGYNFSIDEDNPNVVAPRKRPYHTIIPAIITDDQTGELLCSYGVMGGFMQPQGHVQVLLNMKLFAMNPQQALDKPRFCVGPGHRFDLGPEGMSHINLTNPLSQDNGAIGVKSDDTYAPIREKKLGEARTPVGAVNIEDGIPEATINDLKGRGHEVDGPVTGHKRALFGRGHVITRGAWWADDKTICNDPNVLWSGSDKRADGAAVGY